MEKYVFKEFNNIKEYNQFKKEIRLSSQELLEKLYSFEKDFLEQEYGVFDVNLKIEFNPKLESSLGRYIRYSSDLKIELNQKFVEMCNYLGKEQFIYSVFQHELIHLALDVQGKDFNDGDETFESELSKHEAYSSTATPQKYRGYKTVSDDIDFQFTPTYVVNVVDNNGNVIKEIETKKSYYRRQYSLSEHEKEGVKYLTVDYHTPRYNYWYWVKPYDKCNGDLKSYKVEKASIRIYGYK